MLGYPRLGRGTRPSVYTMCNAADEPCPLYDSRVGYTNALHLYSRPLCTFVQEGWDWTSTLPLCPRWSEDDVTFPVACCLLFLFNAADEPCPLLYDSVRGYTNGTLQLYRRPLCTLVYQTTLYICTGDHYVHLYRRPLCTLVYQTTLYICISDHFVHLYRRPLCTLVYQTTLYICTGDHFVHLYSRPLCTLVYQTTLYICISDHFVHLYRRPLCTLVYQTTLYRPFEAGLPLVVRHLEKNVQTFASHLGDQKVCRQHAVHEG